MHLEYFQLIDRIVDLKVDERTITVEAQVPAQNTIFEGHFPGYPLMPGVLLIEAMAQTSGWLLIALTKFERMPFLAAVKEAKMRSFVDPGDTLTIDRQHRARRLRLRDHRSQDPGRRQDQVCNADLTFGVVAFPNAELRGHMDTMAERIGFPQSGRTARMADPKTTDPGSAEVWITGIGLATSLGEGLDANWDALKQRRVNADEKGFAPYIVHPSRRSISTPRSRRRAISVRWKPGSASAPTPPGSRWIPPASRATRKSCRGWT